MNQFKRAKVIMLPTNTISNIISGNKTNELILVKNSSKVNYGKSQHLYIISDDEIKDGDWYYDYGCHLVNISSIRQYKGQMLSDKDKKILATTDTSLKIEGKLYKTITNLPQPSQQFIEKYIEEYNKGNIIKDVLVEYEYNSFYNNKYFDEELKINPKDNTITIKKLKDSWNRDEVVELLGRMRIDDINKGSNFSLESWIKENL